MIKELGNFAQRFWPTPYNNIKRVKRSHESETLDLRPIYKYTWALAGFTGISWSYEITSLELELTSLDLRKIIVFPELQ